MATFTDYYGLLGISADATAEQVEAAYKHKIREAHPDRHGGSASAEEEAKQLNMARSVLKDSSARRKYDLQWKLRMAAQPARSSANHVAPRQHSRHWRSYGNPREQSIPTGCPQPPQPPPPAPPSRGAGLLGLGALLVGAYLFANKNTYDPAVGRYRGSDGRFRSGSFF